jgi:hypothetical protein
MIDKIAYTLVFILACSAVLLFASMAVLAIVNIWMAIL